MNPKIDITSEVINRMMSGSYGRDDDYREAVLRRTSEALINAGAERVRFYEIGNEEIPELGKPDPVLYLTWLSYTPTVGDRAHLGFSIPLSQASIYQSIASKTRDPVMGFGGDPSPKSWVDSLVLRQRCWIDVLVRDRAKDVGVLSFDWSGPPIDLKREALATLRLVGQLLGFQLAATSPLKERQLQDELLKIYSNHSTSGFPLEVALRVFQDRCDIASLSLFRYEWTSQRLIRQWLHVAGDADVPPTREFNDESFARGEKLSGKAFVSKDYRLVLDFENLRQQAPQLLSEESVAFHESALGTLNTVMYATLGVDEPKYLVRAINHSRDSKLPFIAEAELLDSFARDLSPFIDAQMTKRRSAAIKRLQEHATSGHSLPNLCRSAEAILKEVEDIERITVIMSRDTGQGDRRPHFLWGVHTDRTQELRDSLSRDNRWRGVVSGEITELDVMRRQDSGAIGRAAKITARDNADVGVLPVHSGGTRGVIAFPIRGEAWGRWRRGDLIGRTSMGFLSQVGSMAAQWAEQEYVTAQALGAQRALSLVGHEMTEPLAATKQLAERALALAGQAAGPGGRLDAASIENTRDRLRRHVDALVAAVQLGHLVGRQIDRKIVGQRSRVPVLSLMNYALTRVNEEMKMGVLQVPTGSVRVLRPDGATNAYIVCDRSLVEVAILNILRNAVKYSLRGMGEPAVITTRITQREVRGRAHIEFAITNSGMEISPMARTLVFDAFTRFTDGQDDADRRGMGLGLYLTKQIALAHDGDVSVAQEPTGRRTGSDALVWRTTFALTLRSDLTPGGYTYSADEDRAWVD